MRASSWLRTGASTGPKGLSQITAGALLPVRCVDTRAPVSKRIGPLLAVFFLSGATALVYEVLWTRQLSLIFGVTTYAVSAVLATYMGGLALGSFLMGRVVDRVRSPLMLYAVLEACIGVYALLVPFLLAGLRPVYVEIAHLGFSYAVFSGIRVLLAALVLL